MQFMEVIAMKMRQLKELFIFQEEKCSKRDQ
jgi:hypothetical protein